MNIRYLAKLARIELTEKEAERFKQDLSSILDYINKLDQVNTDNIEPLYQTTGLVNKTRPDESTQKVDADNGLANKLVSQAPRKENGFVKVDPVIKR